VSRQSYLIDGIRLGTASAGIRQNQNSSERDDLAIIEISEGSHVAAVFTGNTFCAAPVTIAKENLAKQHLSDQSPRYLLINSGNANAGTGEQGYQNGLETCQILADQVSCDRAAILPFSTGVIGEQLPVSVFEPAISNAIKNLKVDGWEAASRAIMTTDTRPKQASSSCEIDGKKVSVTGISKGSGMIRPDMATMLAYVATDAAIETSLLNQCLQNAVEKSFNRITVDGDTSTNDSCVLIATGKSGVEIANLDQIQKAVDEVCIELAQAIIKDGEGATKFITIEVNGGANKEEALQVAYTIAHSPLVKTAFFASDPNWGRLLAAIGRAGISNLDIAKVSVKIGDVSLIEDGEPAASYTEEKGATVMAKNEITVHVDLARGSVSETVWTCDLSYDYVKINAEYRT